MTPKPRWTSREIEILSDRVGLDDYAKLARTLPRRSKGAIKLFRCRNKLPRFCDTFYSYSLLAGELGRSRSALRRYRGKGWLVGRRATWSSRYGHHPMIFTEENIVRFLQKHHCLFEWRKIPNLFFRNVVKSRYKGA